MHWLTNGLLPFAYGLTTLVVLPLLIVRWWRKHNQDEPG